MPLNQYKNTFLILTLAVVLAACLPTGKQAATPLPEEVIQLHDCQLSAPGSVIRLAARCGSYEVYEDPQAQSGRKITLNIAIVPAVSRNPVPDPLFFLTGGPGQAATESYLSLAGAFSHLNQKRDIILIDQRGTGKSHPLNCTNMSEDISGEEDLADLAQNCLEGLEADVSLYTTTIAMQDLDQIRQVFGYDQINIYGVSYGTRAALTYMKNYPQHVRSAVLDGVVPQDEALGSDVAHDAQRALDQIFARCQADAACQAAFPDLQTTLNNLLEQVGQKAVMTTFTDPLSGEKITRDFTREELVTTLRLMSYAPEMAALLPLLIDTAHTRQDFAPLAAQYRILSTELNTSISSAMGYSVLCAEDFPFIDAAQTQAKSEDTYYGNLQIEYLQEICRVWPSREVSPDFKKPLNADIPVLLLSGEVDPVTPPENATETAAYLPNSLALVAPGQGHNVVFRGCLPDIVFNFIDSGSVDNLDTQCVQDITAPPFFVDFNGPVP